MNRQEKINSILRMVTGKGLIVTDPNEAFVLMQQNIARKRIRLPYIDYEFGGELKASMERFVNKIRAKRNNE